MASKAPNKYRPSGGDGNKIPKVEKTVAERDYSMCMIADMVKNGCPKMVPVTGPQRAKRLTEMFSAPNGVAVIKRTPSFFNNLIYEVEKIDVKLIDGYGPSKAVERQFIKKDCCIQDLERTKDTHCHYVVQNMMFIKMNGVLLLTLAGNPLLNYEGSRDGMERFLVHSRTRWFAANLMRLPTSPQVIAAQLLRSHARLYSEDKSLGASPSEYHKAIHRLLQACPGIDRALSPEQYITIDSHMRLSWYRIRKRVLERMIEEVNKVTASNEKKFLSGIPFNIPSVAHLVKEIKDQMAICDHLWQKECEGEIVLSEGPDSEIEEQDDMEGNESMGRAEIQGDQRGMNEQGLRGRQVIPWPAPSDQLPPASSRMNQLYDVYNATKVQEQHQERMQQQGTALAQQRMSMGAGTSSAAASRVVLSNGRGGGGGRGGSVSSSSRMITRRDYLHPQQQSQSVYSTPTARPSTPSTSSTPHQVESVQQIVPLTTPIGVPSTAPSTAPPTVSPSQQQSMRIPVPQPGSSLIGMSHMDTRSSGLVSHSSPLLSSLPMSPQLLLMAPDGTMQSIPSVVYVEQTAEGLRQIAPPNPHPQLMMAFSSMNSGRGGRMERGYSGSLKRRRRVSLEKNENEKKKKRGSESDDENSDDGERIRLRGIEREKEEKIKEEMRKKEEELKREKEEEDRVRKEEEEKERKEKEEEDKMIEMERVRREEEIRAEEEGVRLAEEGREEEREEEGEGEEQEVRVLTADSTEECEVEEVEEVDDREKGDESEDGVVTESAVIQRENEEEEKKDDHPPTDNGVEKITEDTARSIQPSAVMMNAVNGETGVTGLGVSPPSLHLPLPPSDSPHEDEDDSDIEIIGEKKGEKGVKKEMSETNGDEVIFIRKTKLPHKRHQPAKVPTNPANRGTLNDSIKEGLNKVMDEERIPKEIKEEMIEESVNTGVEDVKSEVKEEVEEEKEKEKEAMVDIIERGNGENEEMEETMNGSSGLDLITEGDNADMERQRSVLEANTKEDSEAALTAAAPCPPPPPSPPPPLPPSPPPPSTDAVTTVTTVSPLESLPSQPMEGSVQSVMEGSTLSTVSMGVTPRPTLIRLSSQSNNGLNGDTRLSAETIAMLDRTDSLLSSSPFYRGMIEGTEREKEREEEKEKEKRNVDVMDEVDLSETTDPLYLRFHTMRGEAAILSEDRRRATRDESIDSFSKAIVFSHRPLSKGEGVNIKIVDIDTDYKGRLRVGLTTKNPLEYSNRKAIPRQLKNENDGEHVTYMFDSGVNNKVELNTTVGVKLSEKGDVMTYSFNGVEMGILGGGLQMERLMWMILDIFGAVKGVEIVESLFPPQPTNMMDVSSGDQNEDGINKKLMDNSLKGVESEEKKDEGEEEEKEEEGAVNSLSTLVPSQSGNDQSSSIPIITQMVQEKELGETPSHTNEKNLVDTVDIETTEDTVEKTIDEAIVDDTVVNAAEKKGEEEEVMEVMEEEEEPPMKKRRVVVKSSEGMEVMMVMGGEEGKKDDTVDKEEEKGSEKIRKESIDGGMKIEESEEHDVDAVELIDDGVNEKEQTTVDGMEKKKEEGMDVMEMTQTGGDIKEEIMSENETVKEGELREEQKGEEKDEDGEISLKDQENKEEEEKERDATGVHSIVEERQEMEEISCPPSRSLSPLVLMSRRLFGEGCLPFNRTLDAREKNGNEEEKEKEEEEEEKMEVDQEDEDKGMGMTSIRRRSLFGSGSVSIDYIVKKINDKSK